VLKVIGRVGTRRDITSDYYFVAISQACEFNEIKKYFLPCRSSMRCAIRDGEREVKRVARHAGVYCKASGYGCMFRVRIVAGLPERELGLARGRSDDTYRHAQREDRTRTSFYKLFR
jgi:hypothetical protein